MKIGLHLRNSGPHATREMLRDCARIADGLARTEDGLAGIDDLWVFDHIAIPPDQAEGSGGLYVDPLATLAFVAGLTERINIGTRVLILPYRPPLPTAKWIASIQELSNGRLLLGVGVGWMAEEFRVLGVERSKRGRIADQTLEFIHRCFESDQVEANGQRFLFLPRPQRPPIYIGGHAPHALHRAVRYGDGWAAPSARPDQLREPVDELRRLFREAGKPDPEILVQIKSTTDGIEGLAHQIDALGDIGVTRVSIGADHKSAGEFRAMAEQAAALGG